MSKHSWLPTLFAILALACGGGEDTAETTDETTDTTDTAGGEVEMTAEQAELLAMVQELIVPPEQPWSEMSHEDRGTDMVNRFEPTFRVMFQAHDAEEYAHFGCASCHGEDMEERDYAMPSPHLPAVPPAGSDEYRQMAEEHPDVTRFMEEDVTPAMQTMLGMGSTFTCNGCHPAASAGDLAESATRAF